MKDRWIDEPQAKQRDVFLDRSKDYHPQPWEAEYEREFSEQSFLWKSYVNWRRAPYQGQYINIDAEGIRRTWKDPTVRGGTRPIRIFVFGGSTVWGRGARDDYTIPSVLARLLSQRGLSFDVVNFGEMGYVNTQELVTLMLQLRQGNVPDVVVFYDGINDAFSALQNGRAGIPQNEINRQVEFNMSRDPTRLRQAFLRQLPMSFVGWNRLATAVGRRLRASSESADVRDPGHVEQTDLSREVVRLYEGDLKTIQALADLYGFSCHFFWQPVVFTKRNQTDFESQQAAEEAQLRDFFLAAYSEVKSLQSLKTNEHFHDISSIFDDDSGPCYLDFAHLTEDANAKVAKEMTVFLAPAIKE